MTTKGQTAHDSPYAEKVAALSYEEARSQLVEVVARLEQGNLPLAEALDQWELGEALAQRCESWLAGARERLAAVKARTDGNEPDGLNEETQADPNEATE